MVGEKLLILKKANQVILQRVKDLDDKFKEELDFALRTERALKRYERGKFKEKSAKKFLKELEKW